MKKLLLIVLLIVGCDNSTEQINRITVTDTLSISKGDTVYSQRGCIMQFPQEISENYFEAEDIIKEIEISVSDTTSIGSIGNTNTIPLEIWEIKNSQVILLNNQPQSFWYDPNTYTCAFIHYTTVVSPDGTGEGFILSNGNNTLQMGELDTIQFYADLEENVNSIKIVPNPYLNVSGFNENHYNNRIRFTRLPPQCTITIYSINGDIITTLTHNNEIDGNEWWDLSNLHGETITSGIYHFQVESNNSVFNNGVFVYP